VESLGKQLQPRLRGCGQIWSRGGLTHLLRLCVLIKNQDESLLLELKGTDKLRDAPVRCVRCGPVTPK
jgi:hypothetical protein